jgi:hypothetical protein
MYLYVYMHIHTLKYIHIYMYIGVEESSECKDAPEFEFCIITSKFLIECASVNPTLAEYAMTLITDLLHDDDENIEIW